jgi:hypothetical protein
MFALTGARMDRHARRFVDNNEIVIFEQNIQRNRLWPDVDLFRRRLGKINLVTDSDNLPWPTGPPVEPNEPAPDQLLKARPGVLRKLLCQKVIKAELCVAFFYDKLESAFHRNALQYQPIFVGHLCQMPT